LMILFEARLYFYIDIVNVQILYLSDIAGMTLIF